LLVVKLRPPGVDFASVHTDLLGSVDAEPNLPALQADDLNSDVAVNDNLFPWTPC